MSLRAVTVAEPGSGNPIPASDVSYDNTTSGLTATNVQGAIDEVDADIKLKIPIHSETSQVGFDWSLTDAGAIGGWNLAGTNKATPDENAYLQVTNISCGATVTRPTPGNTSLNVAGSTYDRISINASRMFVDADTENARYAVTQPNDITTKAYVDASVTTVINEVLYVEPTNGSDTTGKGTFLSPFKTITFAQTKLPTAGGTIVLVGTTTESFSQNINNLTILGTGTQWSPSSFITGNIVQPVGFQRLRLRDIGINETILIQGNGNNYFQNLNGGHVVFSGSSNGYNEFWECESSSKTITTHSGTIVSNLGRNLNITNNSSTATFISQFCQGGTITMNSGSGIVLLSRCNTMDITHSNAALLIDRTGGLKITSTANTGTAVIKIISSDFLDPNSTTQPVGYFTFQKTGTCPLVTDAITKYPIGMTAPTGTVVIVAPNTPTAS